MAYKDNWLTLTPVLQGAVDPGTHFTRTRIALLSPSRASDGLGVTYPIALLSTPLHFPYLALFFITQRPIKYGTDVLVMYLFYSLRFIYILYKFMFYTPALEQQHTTHCHIPHAGNSARFKHCFKINERQQKKTQDINKRQNRTISSIAAEKALDEMQHPFTLKNLTKGGIERTDLNIIKAIYDKLMST